MKDNLLSRGRYKGCDENGPAAALLVGHVSIQICSLLAPHGPSSKTDLQCIQRRVVDPASNGQLLNGLEPANRLPCF
jgi:hypothetical protein